MGWRAGGRRETERERERLRASVRKRERRRERHARRQRDGDVIQRKRDTEIDEDGGKDSQDR